MAAISSDFLDIDDIIPSQRHQRSRSSGHVDYLQEQDRLERRDRERQMKRYHDSTRQTSSAHYRTMSDHLNIPIFETNRRPRDNQRAEQLDSPTRNFRLEEVRPGPRPLFSYDLNTEPILPSQLPVRMKNPSSQPEKPRITVPPVTIQEHPPSPERVSGRTPRKSPNASPHSPTAQPEIQVQYAALQSRLEQICKSCTPYLDVEPASPSDLTFAKIKETVQGFELDLHIWSRVANMDGLGMTDKDMRGLVDAALETLDRLLDRATELRNACASAKPKDLKLQRLDYTEIEDDVDFYEDVDVDISEDPTEAPGFVVNSLLHSIEMQIRHLKLLTSSLQEATPNAEDEMVKVARLVKEAGKFFGSDAALKLYSIDPRFAGNEAFEQARCAVELTKDRWRR